MLLTVKQTLSFQGSITNGNRNDENVFLWVIYTKVRSQKSALYNVDLSRYLRKQNRMFNCFKISVIVIQKYLHRAFCAIRDAAIHETFPHCCASVFSCSVICEFELKAFSSCFLQQNVCNLSHKREYRLDSSSIFQLLFFVYLKHTKWQSICYSRCFYVFSIGKSESLFIPIEEGGKKGEKIKKGKKLFFLSSSVLIFFSSCFSSPIAFCCFKRQFNTSGRIHVYSSQNEYRMLVWWRKYRRRKRKKTTITFNNVTTFSRLLIADKLVCFLWWKSGSYWNVKFEMVCWARNKFCLELQWNFKRRKHKELNPTKRSVKQSLKFE